MIHFLRKIHLHHTFHAVFVQTADQHSEFPGSMQRIGSIRCLHRKIISGLISPVIHFARNLFYFFCRADLIRLFFFPTDIFRKFLLLRQFNFLKLIYRHKFDRCHTEFLQIRNPVHKRTKCPRNTFGTGIHRKTTHMQLVHNHLFSRYFRTYILPPVKLLHIKCPMHLILLPAA